MGFKTGAVISVLVVLAAYYYRKNNEEVVQERLQKVLKSLLKIEQKHPVDPSLSVGVGYGACLDVFAQASSISMLSLDHDETIIPKHHDFVSSEKELKELFLYFFQHGAAAERYVADEVLFERLYKESMESPNARVALGGNAPVMASRFSKEGMKVLLGANFGPTLSSYLPKDVRVSGEKPLEKDDVHLILEYPKGLTVGKHTAPRANRLILHNDKNNPTINSLEEFQERLQVFNPRLLVVGGLQMMDNFPFEEGVQLERVTKVREHMASQGPETLIHFEMASFADDKLMLKLVENVLPYADSLGMNEQELPNLFSILKYQNVSLISDPYPRVAMTLDFMRSVFKMITSKQLAEGQRPLSRLHIHTLAYQAIMTSKGSPWKNNMAAAAKASLTANRHVCGSSQVDTGKALLIMDDSFSTTASTNKKKQRIHFDEIKPVSCWDEGKVEVCVAPVLVCTEVHQTAGGGDNISAAGLLLQI